MGAELACLFLIDDESRTATGLIGRAGRREFDWFPDVRIDLDNEPSGVATAAFEAAPFAVYDAHASKIVSPRLVEATGARSVAFVPLLADQRVIAVLVVGTTSQPRAFSTEELNLLEGAVGEAALALDRTRSTAALGEALERERFVAAYLRSCALRARRRRAAPRRRPGDRDCARRRALLHPSGRYRGCAPDRGPMAC